MKFTRRSSLKLMGASALAASPIAALADSHAQSVVIKMLNKAPDSNERFVFDPPVVQVEPGTEIVFEATDKSHNSQANRDMIPDGVEPWSGRINQDVTVVLETPGVYGYHCAPHRATGMVGLILVGAVTQEQIDAAKEVPARGKAKARFEEYFAMAEEMIS